MTKKEYKLNPSQLEAVTTTEGPVVVIAGAGTGKTRVIERRVSYLVENRINPSAILLLTFTRKAAREMLSRAARNNPKCKHVDGGTFHSFGFNKLKRYGKAIGLPSYFSILDEGDSEDAIHRCATKLGFYNDKKRFPKKNILKKIISASVNKGLSIKKILTKEYPEYINFIPHIKTLRKIFIVKNVTINAVINLTSISILELEST
ncbi:MAG: UvrD-helicase domain-containing protein [bacterium]